MDKISRRSLLAGTAVAAAAPLLVPRQHAHPTTASELTAMELEGLEPVEPVAMLPHTDRAAVWTCVPVDQPVVFVTIDDGYEEDPAAADMVESGGIAVTPFLTYYAASSGDYPPPTSGPGLAHIQYLRRFIGAGRSGVQCHSKRHQSLTTMSYTEQYNAISAAKKWLARTDMFGPPAPTVLRPPSGQYNDDTLKAAMNNGMPVVLLWTHNVEDLHADPNRALRPGDIILCHFTTTLSVDLALTFERIAAAGLTPAYIADYVR